MRITSLVLHYLIYETIFALDGDKKYGLDVKINSELITHTTHVLLTQYSSDTFVHQGSVLNCNHF